MKKILKYTMLLLMIFTVVGCTKKEDTETTISDAVKFKQEYESLNGTTNASGKEHRTVTIDEDNPFVYVTGDDIVEMMNNNETFYVYFGDKQCPWCRSVIEEAIKVAKEKGVDKIYYVSIWDGDHEEILRDTYTLDENGKAVLNKEGASSYNTLLEKLDNVLSDYNLTDADGNKVSVGEKRIYAPNFIYVENGKAVRLTEGISDTQTDSRGELTEEIIADEEKQFNEFFE